MSRNSLARRRAGLAVVITCAVILSFNGLYDLAVACRFATWLAVLVPVLADAGGALAADVWLDQTAADAVRRYARRLALAQIGASVLGNVASHVLAVLAVPPPWWLVVLVGALAPLVVATNLHLYALVNRAGGGAGHQVATEMPELPARPEIPEESEVDDEPTGDAGDELAPGAGDRQDQLADEVDDVLTKATALAAEGKGRPALVALGLSHHQAKQVIASVRQPTTTNGHERN